MRNTTRSSSTIWSRRGWNPICGRSYDLLPMLTGDSTPSTNFSTERQTLGHQGNLISNSQLRAEAAARRARSDLVNHQNQSLPEEDQAQDQAREQDLDWDLNAHRHRGWAQRNDNDGGKPVYACGAEPKIISFSNAPNTRGPETLSRTNPRTIIITNPPRPTTAKSNANDHSTPSSKKTSLPLPVPGSAREVGRDGAENVGGRHKGLDGNTGDDTASSNSTKTEGYPREPEGSHV